VPSSAIVSVLESMLRSVVESDSEVDLGACSDAYIGVYSEVYLGAAMSTVPSDGRGRWAVPILARTDGTAPEPSVPSKHVNDGETARDWPGTVQTPSPAVIHSPRPTSGS